MKIPKILSFIVIFLFFMQITGIVFAISTPTDCNITSILRIGSKGAEVQCLQGKLGIATDGSFGPLTKLAVMSFQLKNSLKSDGVFGPISRTTLDIVKLSNKTYSTKFKQGPSLLIKKVNPNIGNTDKFIEAVVEVNRKKGSSEADLSLMATTLKQAILSSGIDYNEEFKNLLQRESKLSSILNTQTPLTLFDKIKDKTLSFLGITPPVALAQASTSLPFGGALLLPFFCPISGNWMIGIQPLPPTFVKVLSYFPGTQGFASYNIPLTTHLLGTYMPVGVCSYGVVTIATEGTITPMVGSALIP